jgi:hypothetical protein
MCADAGGDCSLRAAVMEANALLGAHTIALAAETYAITIAPTAFGMFEEVRDHEGDFDIVTDITITGATRDTTILDANDLERLFRVTDLRDQNDGHVISSGKLTLEAMTLQDGLGKVTSMFGLGANGGCIRADAQLIGGVQLSLTDVVVKDCESPVLGGGIYSSVPIALTDVIISGNKVASASTEQRGGGIALNPFAGPSTMLRVTISGNTSINTNPTPTDATGGGISNGAGAAMGTPGTTITDSIISDNRSISPRNGEAAGILNSGTLTLVNVIVQGNRSLTNTTSGAFAGGIENSGTLVMQGGALTANCAARDETTCTNRTPGGSGFGEGGALLNSRCANENCSVLSPGTVTLNDVLIDGNFAEDYGGAISNRSQGTVTINGSEVTDNDAGVGGGGIYNLADVAVGYSTISNNTVLAGSGGGIESCGGTSLAMWNSTVSGNTAQFETAAGGLCLTASETDLSFVTIADNSAGIGGGIYVSGGMQPAKRLKGVLIGDNTATTSGPDCYAAAPLTSLGYNLIENATLCTMAAATGDQLGTGGSPIDPDLGMLQANGGATETHAPDGDSPAVNQVPPASCTDTDGMTVTDDQRRFLRPAGVNCDVGAYERDAVAPSITATPTPTVTPTPTLTFTPASTPTSTPTATATPTPGPVDAFRCYTVKTAKGAAKFEPALNVHVVDPLEDVLIAVQKPQALCAPASVAGTSAGDVATHLERYKIKLAKGQPKHTKQASIRIDNQLGTLFLATAKAVMLMVPTAKDLTNPPSAPDPEQHEVDHYQCYKVKIAKGAPKFPRDLEVTAGDQFTAPPRRYLVKKPLLLCAPADKNGEGVHHAEHQLCYVLKLAKARCADGAPANAGRSCKREEDCGGTKKVTTFCQKQQAAAAVAGVHLANQFGAERVDVRKAAELCLPSVRVP